MVAATHIKHETKAGELNIVLNLGQENETDCDAPTDAPSAYPPGGYTPDQTMIRLTFEDGQTGAFYDGVFTHAELVKICTVFHMTDGIPDIVADMPEIMQDIVGPTWIGTCPRAAGFKYRTGKGREYQIILPLHPRVYSEGTRDLVELRAENSVLRKKVAGLEPIVHELVGKVDRLEKMCKTYGKWFSTIAECQWFGESYHHTASRYGYSDDVYFSMIHDFDIKRLRMSPNAIGDYSYDALQRFIEKGLDVNTIKTGGVNGTPLLFRMLNGKAEENYLEPDFDRTFAKPLEFIQFMLNHHQDPNVTRGGKTILANIDMSKVIWRLSRSFL